MNLNVEIILKYTQGVLIIGDKLKKCEDFSRDTRTVKNGDTYIGIKGENFDGNLLWEEAFKNGADIVIINKIEISKEKQIEYEKQNKCIIMVEDTLIALGQIAKAKRDLYKDKIKVVGVTGSVGKTSTKDIIAGVLSEKYRTLKTEGNNNNNIGLPFTILRLKDEEVAVIEMGMNHLGEIDYLTQIAKPDIAVITNVGTSHIGNLGSRENILKAKLEILNGMDNKLLVLNNDNDLLNNWSLENKGKIEVHTYGIKNRSDVNASNIKLNENSSEFICGKAKIEVPVGGEHFVLNALCAYSVAKLLDLTDVQIINGIKNFKLTAKRMELNRLKNNILIINDSYNASYESMKASIMSLNTMNAKRKIAVLGDMFELGEFSEKLHRDVGLEVFKNKIDNLFLIGENAKFIGEEAELAGYNKENIYYFKNKEELTKKLLNYLQNDDVVLIKASNGMKLFEVADKLKEKLNK